MQHTLDNMKQHHRT